MIGEEATRAFLWSRIDELKNAGLEGKTKGAIGRGRGSPGKKTKNRPRQRLGR